MDKATTAPVTDDAELAKVLEDMNNSMTAAVNPVDQSQAQVVEPTIDSVADTGVVSDDAASATVADPIPQPIDAVVSDTTATAELNFEETPAVAPVTPSVTLSPLSGTFSSDTGDLESIKKDALTELRPLVDKLDLPAEEKFNTLLLIIRSTDDKSLIPSVHDAAKAIDDDAKRAQALLDVIKEIDFFSNPQS